jgi:hypothetical protein
MDGKRGFKIVFKKGTIKLWNKEGYLKTPIKR